MLPWAWSVREPAQRYCHVNVTFWSWAINMAWRNFLGGNENCDCNCSSIFAGVTENCHCKTVLFLFEFSIRGQPIRRVAKWADEFFAPLYFFVGGRGGGNSDCCKASPLLYFFKTTFGRVFVFAFTHGHHFPLWEISCKQIYVTKGFAKLKERKWLHYHCRVSKFMVTGQIWVVRVIIWKVTITHKIQWRPIFWILDFLNPQITSFT